jgi:hypothetical protein
MTTKYEMYESDGWIDPQYLEVCETRRYRRLVYCVRRPQCYCMWAV